MAAYCCLINETSHAVIRINNKAVAIENIIDDEDSLIIMRWTTISRLAKTDATSVDTFVVMKTVRRIPSNNKPNNKIEAEITKLRPIPPTNKIIKYNVACLEVGLNISKNLPLN